MVLSFGGYDAFIRQQYRSASVRHSTLFLLSTEQLQCDILTTTFLSLLVYILPLVFLFLALCLLLTLLALLPGANGVPPSRQLLS